MPIEVLAPAVLGPEALAAKPFLALEHNRQNYALAVALADGVLGQGERQDWRHLSPVDGRFDCRVIGNRTIVIDFAHTPDALETILTAIRDGFPGARVLTLFGCGGDRDHGKRPLMGAAVARHSDLSIVTSDNPRTEEPERIIADILEGMPPAGRDRDPRSRRGHRPSVRPARRAPGRRSPGSPSSPARVTSATSTATATRPTTATRTKWNAI